MEAIAKYERMKLCFKDPRNIGIPYQKHEGRVLTEHNLNGQYDSIKYDMPTYFNIKILEPDSEIDELYIWG